MPLTFTENSATISTSEYSLPGNTTTAVPTQQTDDCMLQAMIDFGALASGDQYQVRLYELVTSSGAQRLVEEWTVSGAQLKPAFVMPAIVLGNGWDLTVKKLAGTDRTVGWSLRKIT